MSISDSVSESSEENFDTSATVQQLFSEAVTKDNYEMAKWALLNLSLIHILLIGFIAQGDISYVGPYTQLVKEKIKVDNLAERVFELGYSDFFKIKEDGQFEW